MNRIAAMTTTTLATAAIALLPGQPVAKAEPVAPQADTECSPSLAGALTWLPDKQLNLVCSKEGDSSYRWTATTFPDPPGASRLLTYGPKVTMTGAGTQKSMIVSGDWVALPQDSDSQCIVDQFDSATAQAAPTGKPLSFRVPANMTFIDLKGYCLWTRVGP